MKKNTEEDIKNTIENIYFKSISDISTEDDFVKNELKIAHLKEALLTFNIPNDLINLLIETVQENVSMEYDRAIKNIIDYLEIKKAN